MVYDGSSSWSPQPCEQQHFLWVDCSALGGAQQLLLLHPTVFTA